MVDAMSEHRPDPVPDPLGPADPSPDPAPTPAPTQPRLQPRPRDARPVRWWKAFRRAPRALRWSVWTAVGLVLVLLVLAAAVVGVVRRPLPQTSGEVEVAGLSAEVEVIRDGFHIPQIYADTDADLMFAQGYVHAQERFFEMDFRRHVTAGRLSEIFGRDTLSTDKFIRTMGWRRVAEEEWALLEPATRDALTSYAAGVNAYIADRKPSELAAEYAVLGLTGLDYTPEEWEPVDSLAWLKAMAWDLRGNMDAEVDRVLLSLDHTAEQIAELWPGYPYADHPPIVSGGGVVDGVFEQNATGNGTRNPRRPAYPQGVVKALERVQDRIEAMPELRRQRTRHRQQLVGGRRRALRRPASRCWPTTRTWASASPASGCRWDCTAASSTDDCTLDSVGLHVLRRARRGHRPQRRHRLGLHQPRSRRDRPLPRADRGRRPLRPRRRDGGDDGPHRDDRGARRRRRRAPRPRDRARAADQRRVLGVRQRRAPTPRPTSPASAAAATPSRWHGPPSTPPRPPTRSSGSTGPPTGTSSARPPPTSRCPAQNMVYADREGHIGYQAPGPRSRSVAPGNDGTMPVEGWISANDWTGDYIPFDGLPSVLDPEEGFIVTANQAVIDEDYPYLLTQDWDYGYRSTRIRERARRRRASCRCRRWRSLQLDTTNPMAEVLVPYLLDVEDLPVGLLPRRPGPAARLGLHPAGRQRAGGVLQRRVAQRSSS